jgi:hypothetical protein
VRKYLINKRRKARSCKYGKNDPVRLTLCHSHLSGTIVTQTKDPSHLTFGMTCFESSLMDFESGVKTFTTNANHDD